MISLNAHLMSHTLHERAIHLPSTIPITCGGRYNLWSYTVCSFLKYPISFSHNSLSTNQHCSQTQSTVFPQCHSQIVTPTAIKILCKHTISIFKLSKSRKESKSLWSCSRHYSKLISSKFLHPPIFIASSHSKILQVPQPSKTSNNVSAEWRL